MARADGVPLFVEELAKSAVESRELGLVGGRHDVQRDDAVPTTLQDSLNARLDRLSSAKVVAQIAATLGREFSFELVAAVADLKVSTLAAGLAQLVEAEILYERGRPPHASYFFKHALLQDTAYQSQLRSQRRERHARAAQVIEERFASIAAAEPEALAHHCVEGGLPERAAGHFERAGRAAIERYANTEAVDCLRRGLAQVELLPDGPTRQQLEITLRVGLGGPLAALRGFDAAEVAENYARVRELVDLVGEGPQQLTACIGLINYYAQCSEFARLTEIGHAIVRIAESLDISVLLALGKLLIGLSRLTFSAQEAIDALRPAIALADQGALPPPTSVHEPDMAAWGYAMGAFAYVIAGDPGRDFAISRWQRRAPSARPRQHHRQRPGHGLRRAVPATGPGADRVAGTGGRRALRRPRLPQPGAPGAGVPFLGWCGSRKPARRRRLRRRRRSLRGRWIALDARLAAHHRRRRPPLDRSSRRNPGAPRPRRARDHSTGETGYLTWTLWIRGLLTVASGDRIAGERILRDALEMARQRGDHIGALRCAVSLAETLQSTGRGAEGRALLTDWLPPHSTAAADATPLLRQARALLTQ